MTGRRRRRLKKPVKYAIVSFITLVAVGLLTLGACTLIKNALSGEKKVKPSGVSTEVPITVVDGTSTEYTPSQNATIEFLNLDFGLNDDNTGTVTIEGTEKQICEIQILNNSGTEWETLCSFNAPFEENMITTTLPSERTIKLRAISYNSDNSSDISFSEEIDLRTKRTPVGSIIWPIKPISIYDSPAAQNKVGSLSGGEAMIVEALEDGYFLTTYNGVQGYVKAAYCMINLPDYLGDTCSYNITNSYSSIFKVHYAIIPEVTGTVIPGFEGIRQADNEYLVPYLYPCADKLAKAASIAAEQNYKLKIYEAYRPHEATRYLYDTVNEILYDEISDNTTSSEKINPDTGNPYTAEELRQLKEEESARAEEELEQRKQQAYDNYYQEAGKLLIDQGVSDLNSPDAISVMQQYASQKLEKEFSDTATANIAGENTYYMEMTNNEHALGAFLAREVSAHNRGIALDLTLEDMNTGIELSMQTAMHDLSYHSVVSENNENADKLGNIMKAAGFGGLSSEWWHFQDNETRESLNLSEFLEKGVSAP